MRIIIACLLKKDIEPDDHLSLLSALESVTPQFLKVVLEIKHHMYVCNDTHIHTCLSSSSIIPMTIWFSFNTFMLDYVWLLWELIHEIIQYTFFSQCFCNINNVLDTGDRRLKKKQNRQASRSIARLEWPMAVK